jgi:hypothetical protein
MTLHDTLARFNSALSWNAALYIIYKIFFTGLSLALFNTLRTNDYSLWANTNSIIFLFLLWIDCGMRKSVPRFIPEFLFSERSTHRFLIWISALQMILIVAATPFLYKSLSYTATALHQDSLYTITFGLALFFTQGIIAIIRLIYHSYFMQKQFNLLAIIIMTIEMICNLFFFFRTEHTVHFVYTLFTTKLCADVTLAVISIPLFIKLTQSGVYPELIEGADKKAMQQTNNTPTEKKLEKQFIVHSFFMWVTTAIKSLTERNFLVPLITHTAGPEAANIFKVANDGALIFYRFILKTIGTADTSLLTYAGMQNKKDLLDNAFTKLRSRVAGLCLPLLGVIVLLAVYKSVFFSSHYVFHIFILMATCYLIETLLLPFERIIEVKRDYFRLIIGYIPYVIIIFIITNRILITSIGTVQFIIIVHSVRLVSAFLFVYLSRRVYSVRSFFS